MRIIYASVTAIVMISLTIAGFVIFYPVMRTLTDTLNSTVYDFAGTSGVAAQWNTSRSILLGLYGPLAVLLVLFWIFWVYLYAQEREYVTGRYY